MIPKKLPFPKFILTTPCSITVYSDGLNPDTGEPNIIFSWSGKVNWSEKTKRIMNSDKVLIELLGTVVCEGDIAPNILTFQGGTVDIGGRKFEVHSSARGQNPDGTVFSTELYLF